MYCCTRIFVESMYSAGLSDNMETLCNTFIPSVCWAFYPTSFLAPYLHQDLYVDIYFELLPLSLLFAFLIPWKIGWPPYIVEDIRLAYELYSNPSKFSKWSLFHFYFSQNLNTPYKIGIEVITCLFSIFMDWYISVSTEESHRLVRILEYTKTLFQPFFSRF